MTYKLKTKAVWLAQRRGDMKTLRLLHNLCEKYKIMMIFYLSIVFLQLKINYHSPDKYISYFK